MWILEHEFVPELSKSSTSNEPLQTDIWLTACVRSHVDSSPRVALWQLQRSHHLPTPMASSVRIIINIQQHQGHHQHLQDRLNLVITNHAVGIRRLHSFTILITNHAVGIRRLHSFKVLIRTHAVGIGKLHSFRVIITNHAVGIPRLHSFKVLITNHAVGIRKLHSDQL